jgi:hypothetical protein
LVFSVTTRWAETRLKIPENARVSTRQCFKLKFLMFTAAKRVSKVTNAHLYTLFKDLYCFFREFTILLFITLFLMTLKTTGITEANTDYCAPVSENYIF